MNHSRTRGALARELPPKTQLGPYILGQRVGVGGMAEVYEAQYMGTQGRMLKRALKLIHPHWALSEDAVGMFHAEAKLSRLLHHSSIVQVLDSGEADGRLYIALEYVDGISCAKLLRTLTEREQTVDLEAAVYIAMRALSALAYAHNLRNYAGKRLGIVHRDVSPGNILLSRGGEVKITDFGIALSDHMERNTMPGEVKGKYGYMSPEQVAGMELDPRTDLFSLGTVLAEMLVGKRLFSGKNQYEVLTRMHLADISVFEQGARNVPGPLADVVRKALTRRRRDRYQSAMEFLSALLGAVAAAGIKVEDGMLARNLFELGLTPQQSGTREVVDRRESASIDSGWDSAGADGVAADSSPPTMDRTTIPVKSKA